MRAAVLALVRRADSAYAATIQPPAHEEGSAGRTARSPSRGQGASGGGTAESGSGGGSSAGDVCGPFGGGSSATGSNGTGCGGSNGAGGNGAGGGGSHSGSLLGGGGDNGDDGIRLSGFIPTPDGLAAGLLLAAAFEWMQKKVAEARLERELTAQDQARLPCYYPISLRDAVAACAAFLTGATARWPRISPSAGGFQLEAAPLTGRPRIALPPARKAWLAALQNPRRAKLAMFIAIVYSDKWPTILPKDHPASVGAQQLVAEYVAAAVSLLSEREGSHAARSRLALPQEVCIPVKVFKPSRLNWARGLATDVGIVLTRDAPASVVAHEVAHWLLRHSEESLLTYKLLPAGEHRTLRIFQELEADQLATILLARTGRDPWLVLQNCLSDHEDVAEIVSQHGVDTTLQALSRVADLPAVTKLSRKEVAVRWPGCDKQVWNYAHILGGAQRMSEQHLRRAALSMLCAWVRTKAAALAGAALSGSGGNSGSGSQ